MANLEDTVRAVVQDFMSREVLFTALDVSNAVKQQFPFARHREVRDVVRGMFATDIETQGWARTPITVNLEDGTTAEALLYHPLTDSWDLDNKYSQQARSATSFRPAATTVAPTAPAASTAGTLPAPTSTPTPTPVATPAPAPTPPARAQWDALFATTPSLFPQR